MFKKVTDDAILPQAQTQYSAGYDVFANEDVAIHAGETKLIPLGVTLSLTVEGMQLYKDRFIGLFLRSSFGMKGLSLPNGVGVIDIDFPDEIKIAIKNPISGTDYKIKKGDRVGQLVLLNHYGFEMLGGKYRKEAQRQGGFGSSGEKD